MSTPDPASPAQPHEPRETPKETLISVIMSFALVFVFTRFVAASYVIPTGSMAPTLMGAHFRLWSDETGDNWPVNYSEYPGQSSQSAGAQAPRPTTTIQDTITGQPAPPQPNMPRRSGDRIFVLNYLQGLNDPRRWDIAVFKFPGNARENYIKRLVGLPGEDLWLADGDIFTRPAAGLPATADDGWTIQRKPARVQRNLWRTLYSSELRPRNSQHNGRPWRDRWIGEGWQTDGLALRRDSPAPAVLLWDSTARPIDDWVAYNDSPPMGVPKRFPVSDLRMRAGVAADQPGLNLEATITARSHEFQMRIGDGRVSLLMRRQTPPGQPAPDWTQLASAASPLAAFTPGHVADVEFWQVDQSLQTWIDGRLIAAADYDWTPPERLSYVLRRSFTPGNPVIFEGQYERPRVQWTVSGSPVSMHRVGLDRDIYCQPILGGATLARGVWNDRPLRLGPDQYFVLGDNSAASGDGRLWDRVDPWVATQIDPTPGIVPRRLMLGKAFCVFWPSLHKSLAPVPVPDFGRMRWLH